MPIITSVGLMITVMASLAYRLRRSAELRVMAATTSCPAASATTSTMIPPTHTDLTVPGRTQTMPLAIHLGFELDLQAAMKLSVVLLLSLGVLLLVRGVLHQRIEAAT